MSQTHTGNLQPAIDYEEHDGAINAKRVSLASAPTIYAIVDITVGDSITLNSNVTINPSPNYIGLTTTIPNYFGNTAISSVASIASTSTQITPSNTSRFSLILRNISNTTVFISFISPVTTSSMYLRQDDSLTLDRHRGAVFGIVTSGSGEIRYLEEST